MYVAAVTNDCSRWLYLCKTQLFNYILLFSINYIVDFFFLMEKSTLNV